MIEETNEENEVLDQSFGANEDNTFQQQESALDLPTTQLQHSKLSSQATQQINDSSPKLAHNPQIDMF